MAAGSPAGALLHAQGVVGTSDQNSGAAHLLEVAFHTEIRVAHRQHLGVHRTMSRVADGATLARGLVLENVRATLRAVATEAALVFRKQGGPTTSVSGPLVRWMTISTGHFAFRHWMVAGQVELAAHVGVALEANCLFCSRRVNGKASPIAAGRRTASGKTERRFRFSAGFGVEAARAMARFAAGTQGIRSVGNETRMIGSGEIAIDFIVALFAFLRAYVFGSRNIGQHYHSTIHCLAGTYGQKRGGCQSEPDEPASACSQDPAQQAEFAICHEEVWLSFGLAVHLRANGLSFSGLIHSCNSSSTQAWAANRRS